MQQIIITESCFFGGATLAKDTILTIGTDITDDDADALIISNRAELVDVIPPVSSETLEDRVEDLEESNDGADANGQYPIDHYIAARDA